MPTIKDVANQAGVSTATVSIIMNGKAETRKIPESTCQRVWEAARAVGYQPDLRARSLRKGDDQKPIVAFYWPLDYRLPILASFINGISKTLKEDHRECELVIQAFENDRLSEAAHALRQHQYSAAIIGACSEKDLHHLESLKLHIPVVLINRSSEIYSSVEVDNQWIGSKAAQMLFQKGYREAVAVVASERYLQTQRRTNAFLTTAQGLGIQIPPEYILKVTGTMAGGVEAALRYLSLKEKPKVMFCESDSLALGVLNTFQRLGVSVPQDLEVLAISMSGKEETLYAVPSLSVIELPNELLAAHAIRLILQQQVQSNAPPVHQTVACNVILRDSFRMPSITPPDSASV